MALRSKSPELVSQEIWGHLCCHYAVRTLMWEAAERVDEDPDLAPSSQLCASPVVRSPNGALFTLDDDDATALTWRKAIVQPLWRCNPARRHRPNPHLIKRKMPKWHVKRRRHLEWPQPTIPPLVQVLAPN